MRAALADLGNRVGILTRSRTALLGGVEHDVVTSLRGVCEALQVVAEPKGILISFMAEGDPLPLSEGATLAAALAVNELITNALKYAFLERAEGHIKVCYHAPDEHMASILVEDDGLPFAVKSGADRRVGGGLGLIRRLVDQQDGMLIAPQPGSKRFELRFRCKPAAMAAA